MFTDPVFKSFKNQVHIPDDVEVIVCADLFVDEYIGGAELTTQALIDSSHLKIAKIKSQDLNSSLISRLKDKFWIFGNYSNMNLNLIPEIIATLKYVVLEYDYKFCKFRSPEKHQFMTKSDCNCESDTHGQYIANFYQNAEALFWMSQKQLEAYTSRFPQLLKSTNIVLSSVFSTETLNYISRLIDQQNNNNIQKQNWVVLGSNSWVKGLENAKNWIRKNNKVPVYIWDTKYEEVLDELSKAEGFVYLPEGSDTCPRMVIEAKLLGCKLVLNDFVQHKDEEWFNQSNEQIIDYLKSTPKLFWDSIQSIIDYVPTISGYVTVYNCIKQQYPFEQCIKSMLAFCNEVCVVDGGSTDGTYGKLLDIASCNPALKVKQIKRDWNSPRYALFDGQQKAEARDMCTSDFCWQMDSDEIVHEDDYEKIHQIAKFFPKHVDVLSLPVIEYWGSLDKVRADIQPWKWRLSRNDKTFTHGIPANLRTLDKHGFVVAKPGSSDGCDMISKVTGEVLRNGTFYSSEVDSVRLHGLNGNKDALKEYETWFNTVVATLPTVFHYSWVDIERKIKLYQKYWSSHWRDIWDLNNDDTSENNMFFDCPWSEVTDEMIKERAVELSKTGGWIFHEKWNGIITPAIYCSRTQPKVMSTNK